MSQQNPCERCGACCAMWRVAFDAGEVDNIPGGVVPLSMTCKLSETRAAMRGTERKPVRCEALSGTIGSLVHCTIYDRRPTNCRLFLSVWETNVVNSLCDRARVMYGLVPISRF